MASPGLPGDPSYVPCRAAAGHDIVHLKGYPNHSISECAGVVWQLRDFWLLAGRGSKLCKWVKHNRDKVSELAQLLCPGVGTYLSNRPTY